MRSGFPALRPSVIAAEYAYARHGLGQLLLINQEDRVELEFHRGILENTLPLSIGGGIGQSRLCMLLLHKPHIAEVQVSVWPRTLRQDYAPRVVQLL